VSEYGQFCPVSKAAEVICERWAILVVRELLTGSRRFVELRRGLPGCPPATLSKRLKQLEAADVVDRVEEGGSVEYHLTEAGLELLPIVQGFGEWGQRWARSAYTDDELDPDVLLWDVRRFLDPAALERDPCVIQLDVELPKGGRKPYWVVVDRGQIDLCMVDPRREVDAVVRAHVRTLTQIWMGDTTFARAQRDELVTVDGQRAVVRRLPSWFGQHPILAPIAPAVGR
jgi:DNA-binding HxlR family transcriptional regulator